MKVYDYFCEKCGKAVEKFSDGEQTLPCDCGGEAIKMPCAVKNYTIWGDNSASVTPKKFDRMKK